MSASMRSRHPYKRHTNDDSDNESVASAIDEQEQEELITQLETLDSNTISLYRTAFTVLAVCAILPYIIFSAGLPLAVMAITSILSSAYTLYAIPLPAADRLAPWTKELLPTGDSPITRYLPSLNALLVAMITLPALLNRSKANTLEHSTTLHMLPCIIFIVVTIARSQLRPVNFAELSKLKYNYKGA